MWRYFSDLPWSLHRDLPPENRRRCDLVTNGCHDGTLCKTCLILVVIDVGKPNQIPLTRSLFVGSCNPVKIFCTHWAVPNDCSD